MAERTPMVKVGGYWRELPAGDTTAGASGGEWTSYTPTVTSGSGSFTTVSATGKYKTIGKTTFFQIRVTITNAGTAAGVCYATLPNTAEATGQVFTYIGYESAASGISIRGIIAPTTADKVEMVRLDTLGTCIFTSYVLNINGTYPST